jgi:hypothetical protein
VAHTLGLENGEAADVDRKAGGGELGDGTGVEGGVGATPSPLAGEARGLALLERAAPGLRDGGGVRDCCAEPKGRLWRGNFGAGRFQTGAGKLDDENPGGAERKRQAVGGGERRGPPASTVSRM